MSKALVLVLQYGTAFQLENMVAKTRIPFICGNNVKKRTDCSLFGVIRRFITLLIVGVLRPVRMIPFVCNRPRFIYK